MPGPTTPWRPGRFDHEGETLYYEVTGPASGSDGSDRPVETVVLCHGAAGNHAVWYQQVVDFAADHRVVTWDQRGFGRSTRRGEIGPEPAVRDLLALLDHLGVEAAHVVGQSMGGWCALGCALRAPHRVRSLVLADTLGGIFTDAIVEDLTSRPRPPVPPDPPVLGVHPAVWELDAKDLAQAFLYQQISSLAAEVPSLEAVALLLQTRWSLDDVRALRTPTLFVYGDRDNLFPPAVLKMAADEIAGAEVREIPGATHSPYFEQAPAWNAAVREFLHSH